MKDFATALLMLIAGVLLALSLHFKIKEERESCFDSGRIYFKGQCL